MHYIFRKSDGIHLATAHRPDSVQSQFDQTVNNEGGTEADYVIVESMESADSRSLEPHLSEAGALEFVATASALEEQAEKTAYLAGTTDEKLDILARRLKILDRDN